MIGLILLSFVLFTLVVAVWRLASFLVDSILWIVRFALIFAVKLGAFVIVLYAFYAFVSSVQF